MTATDELRRMLDERGVEWTPSVFDPQHETFYSTENGVGFIVTEFPEIQRMSLACDMRITPEQAIAATLGSSNCTNGERTNETCRDAAGKQMAFFACSVCGASNEHKHPRFCYGCGRKVVTNG